MILRESRVLQAIVVCLFYSELHSIVWINHNFYLFICGWNFEGFFFPNSMLLWIKLLWTFRYRSLNGHGFIPLGHTLRSGFAQSYSKCIFKKLKFSKMLAPAYIPMATHFSILAWRIPMDIGAWRATAHGLQRVGHDRATKHSTSVYENPRCFTSIYLFS